MSHKGSEALMQSALLAVLDLIKGREEAEAAAAAPAIYLVAKSQNGANFLVC